MTSWNSIRELQLAPSLKSLTGAMLFVFAIPWSGLLWGRILNALSPHRRVAVPEAMRVYSAGWLLKYVPGQVGAYLYKIGWGVGYGVSKSAVTSSFVYENILLLAGSLVLALPFTWLSLSFPVLTMALWPIWFGLSMPVILWVHQKFYRQIMHFMLKKYQAEERLASCVLSRAALFKIACGYLGPRVMNAVGFVLIADAILPFTPAHYLHLGAVYVLAGAIGLVAIFVPSGLGVRESVIVAGLSGLCNVEEAMLIAVLARFYSTAADIGVAILYTLLTWMKRIRPASFMLL